MGESSVPGAGILEAGGALNRCGRHSGLTDPTPPTAVFTAPPLWSHFKLQATHDNSSG